MTIATRPTSVTMWDFSWLLRRHGRESEYADVDRVLDELAERGYDSVRIDAFPHWVAADENGVRTERITALPQGTTFMWGNHETVEVEPTTALLEFLDGLRARGLRVALSTWLTPDATARSEQVRTPEDLARVWIETLTLIEEAGYTNLIDYVDLCNEWPLFTPGPQTTIWPDGAPHGEHLEPWSDEEVARIDAFAAAVRAVKDRFPELPVLFSYCLRNAELPAADDCMRITTDGYDLAEAHLWLSSTPDFVRDTSFANSPVAWDRLAEHQRAVAQAYWPDRARWMDDLDQLMRRWKHWADDRGLPLWTTECWASVFWNPDLSDDADPWAYVRDVAEFAVPRAIEYGWVGIATSNFSQPHHKALWADADWHRRMNDLIHNR
ncbi:sugar-binding cellulase-like protein [Curtobacterium sp. PhB136]|nr:sugar-binding cellulase-like protein [Curtobacterium sp. PhB136]